MCYFPSEALEVASEFTRRRDKREKQQRTREVNTWTHATDSALTTTSTLLRTWRRKLVLRHSKVDVRLGQGFFFCGNVVALSMMMNFFSHDPARRAMNKIDVSLDG